MYDWVRKIHMYAGLLSFTAFVVWGVTGIHAVFLPQPGQFRPPDVSSTREVHFAAPGTLDDEEMAQRVFAASGITLANPPNNAGRDENHNLAFTVYTPNGRRDVTYFEQEGRILIEFRTNDLAGFFSSMHTGRAWYGPPDLAARMWGGYNEFSNWAFLFMIVSGIYLWLATRPRLRWAWATAAASVILVAALWAAL